MLKALCVPKTDPMTRDRPLVRLPDFFHNRFQVIGHRFLASVVNFNDIQDHRVGKVSLAG